MPFIKNDKNINRAGRPLKENTLTDLMTDYLESIEKHSSKAKKQLLTETLIDRAIQGNIRAIRIVFDYVIGKPVQTIQTNNSIDNPILKALENERIKIDYSLLSADELQTIKTILQKAIITDDKSIKIEFIKSNVKN